MSESEEILVTFAFIFLLIFSFMFGFTSGEDKTINKLCKQTEYDFCKANINYTLKEKE